MTQTKHHSDNIEEIIKREIVTFRAARAHKPGGMNVDHRATKVRAWVKIEDLPLSSAEKKLLRKKLEKHINNEDELWALCDETRSQELNKDEAVEKLRSLVREALAVPPPRIPNEPPRSAENERIEDKKHLSEKKQMRREGREPAGNP